MVVMTVRAENSDGDLENGDISETHESSVDAGVVVSQIHSKLP